MADNERCWASNVSECGEDIAEPSNVTRGVLPTVKVKVQGASTTPESAGGPRHEELATAALCPQHRQELALLDDALIDFVNCSREVERLRGIRAAIAGKTWPQTRFTVDGARIERCVLKMLMNHARGRREALAGWSPPAWLPAAIFGKRSLEPQCGLGVIARVGDVVTNTEEVSFVFAQSPRAGTFDSVLLEIRGAWRLICTWETPLKELGELRFSKSSYAADADVLHHPRKINFVNGQHDLGVALEFDWTGRWTESKHRNVVTLRGKFSQPRP